MAVLGHAPSDSPTAAFAQSTQLAADYIARMATDTGTDTEIEFWVDPI